MPEILNFKGIVRKVLEEYPEARDNDYILYFYLVQKTDPNPIHSRLEMSLEDALKAMDTGELPSIYSISRARRSVQEEAAASSDKMYLCGNRTKKQQLSEDVAKKIISNKNQNKENGN